jgi:RNA recognition motif-containing protein
MSGYSDTRVYIGHVPREGSFALSGCPDCAAEKRDFERFFQGYGELTEVKLMAGFAFVEFRDARDAKDAVAGRVAPYRILLTWPRIKYISSEIRNIADHPFAGGKKFLGETCAIFSCFV